MKTKQQRAAEFIAKAKEIHGDKYDYSAVEYDTARKKVEIICPEHGSFFQTPDSHTGKKPAGCKQCGTEQSRLKKINVPQIGEQFGYLTVKEFSHWTVKDRVVNGIHFPSNRQFWVFTCSACGNDHYVADIAQIRNESKKDDRKRLSCGCGVGHNDWNIQGAAKTKEQVFTRLAEWSHKVDSSNAVWNGPKKLITGLYCKVHKVEYSAHPNSILYQNSTGCDLCGREKGGSDGISRFLDDHDYANSDCRFYVAEINGHYLKPGIAIDVDKRADQYYSRYLFVSPKLTRCEAWTIEQCILCETRDAMPNNADDLPFQWGGLTELRERSIYSSDWLVKAYNKLYEMLCDIGWLALYEQRNIWNY